MPTVNDEFMTTDDFMLSETPLVETTLDQAMQVNPEQAAREMQLSRDAGISTDAVKSDPDAVDRGIQINSFNFHEFGEINPRTEEFFSDLANASMAHDDVHVMKGIEDILKNPIEYIEDIGASFTRGQTMVESADLGKTEMFSVLGVSDPLTEEQTARQAELQAQMREKQTEYSFVTGIPTAAAEQLPILGDILTSGAIGAAAGGAVGAAAGLPFAGVGAIPAALTGAKIGGRLGVAKAAFDLEAGLAFTEFKALTDEEGDPLDPKIAAYGATAVGTINAALESLSLIALGRTITPALSMMIKSKVKRALATETGREAARRIGGAYATAVATESVTEGLQELTNIIGGEFSKFIDSGSFTDQDIGSVLDNIFSGESGSRILSAAEKGAQASILLSAPGTAATVVVDNRRKKQLAASEQARITELGDITETSKLKGREKESFRQFMQTVDQETEVYLDSEKVREYMAEMTAGDIAKDPVLTTLNEGLNAAGTDITMPIADFATDMVGSDHFEALRPHMKLSAETATPFRQQQQEQEQADYVKGLIEQANETVSEYTEAQDIFTSVRDQLIDTGQMTPQQAGVMATVVPAWATVQAKQRGIPVAQVYEESGFNVTGPQTGELDRLSAEVLKQRGVSTADFSSQLKADHNLTSLNLYESGGDLKLDTIIVPKEERKAGVGTAVMNKITDYADANGKRVTLSPAVKDDFQGTTSRARLVKFYKRFGFVENKGRNKDFEISGAMYRDPVATPVFRQAAVDTATPAFEKWSGGGEVVEPEDVNDHVFKADTPVVLKVFHGTTHKFSVFDALRGNMEGQFGAINYFTSSESDARDNYAGEGPDLTQRIELRAERLADEIQDVYDEHETDKEGVAAIKEQFGEEFYNEDTMEFAKNIVRQELHGGEDQTLELFVKVENPFVIGENAEWIEFVDNDEINSEAMAQVADNEGITVEEVEVNRDDYEDQIDEARWEIEDETPHKLHEAIQTVSDRHGVDAANLSGEVYDLGSESRPEDVEQLLRSSEDYQYAEGEEGDLIQSQLIAEVIEEMGFDSIILRNAESRFETMNIEGDTAHVHIFDSNKTNIKSVENIGTFDPTDPDIFKQPSQVDADTTRGYYDPANSMIRLTEASNLSTFLHEFAHFMYDMELKNPDSVHTKSINKWFKSNAELVATEATNRLRDATKNEAAIVSVQNVTDFIDNGTTGDEAIDAALLTATHEQFSRGFETYIMEGKAPSMELRNVFRTFAQWLTRVYQSVKGDLQVDLDDEMRQVFDRLLATDEQIEAAKARAQFEPMFTDAAMAGMTEEQFKAYNEKVAKVTAKATETLRDKMIKQLTAQTSKWWNVEKTDLAEDELEILKNEPVYRAATALKSGTIKLDHATIKDSYSETRTNKLGKTSVIIPQKLIGMTVKGGEGLHPDAAAALLGYNSGDEMVQELLNAAPIKELANVNAQAKMIQIHGDILNDGTIEQQADAALQNEEKGKLILAELKTLSRGTSRATINNQMIKTLAEENIAKLTFREINPNKYRAAELDAAKESAAALATGNKEGAATAKARQLLNFYLGKAATDAKADFLKRVDNTARYNKKSVKEAIIKSEGGHWEQLTRILERFEFRKTASMRQVDRTNESLQLWAARRIEEEGDALVLDPAVLDEGYITHWKNVTYNDLIGITDSLKNIEHVARYGNRIKRMQEELDFQQLVQRWVTSIEENGIDVFKAERTTVIDGTGWIKGAVAGMSKIPWMMSWLDGGERAGMSHDIMMQPFNDALDEEFKLWSTVGTPVMEAIQQRDKETMKRHSKKLYIPEIADVDNDGHLFGHQVLAVALNTGNQSNLKKMLLGEGWADPENEESIVHENPQLQAVLAHMTQEDWVLVQKIWDQMDLLYPQLAEVHRKTTGMTPPKVMATEVVTPFGTFKGGYYPVKYDPSRSFKAQKNEDKLAAETESMFSGMSLQASVTASATSERTGYYGPIRLSLDVVPNHFQETIHFITHHDAVRETNKLIGTPAVQTAITAKLGPDEFKQLKPWLNDIAKEGRAAPTKTFIGDIFQKLRFGVTLGVMGFKASTGIIQLLGLSNSMAEVGSKNMYKSARIILGSRKSMKDALDFAMDNSKVFPHRLKTMDREINTAMKKIEGKSGVLPAVQEASMKHIAYIQTYMVDLPTWHAAYIKGVDQWGDEQRAVKYADWVIENVQGSGATKDMAQIMRNQDQVTRTMTMFMTFFSSLWNAQRDVVRGAKSGQYSVSSISAKMMFMLFIPVYLEMMLRGEDEDDKDGGKTEFEKYLLGLALYPAASVPVVRDIASGVLGDFGYNMSPIAQILESGVQATPKLVEGMLTDKEITKAQVKGASKLAGAALGIPGVSQVWSTGEHLYSVLSEGEELTTHQLLFGPDRNKE